MRICETVHMVGLRFIYFVSIAHPNHTEWVWNPSMCDIRLTNATTTITVTPYEQRHWHPHNPFYRSRIHKNRNYVQTERKRMRKQKFSLMFATNLFLEFLLVFRCFPFSLLFSLGVNSPLGCIHTKVKQKWKRKIITRQVKEIKGKSELSLQKTDSLAIAMLNRAMGLNGYSTHSLTLSAPEDLSDVKLNHRVRLKSHVKNFQIDGPGEKFHHVSCIFRKRN